MIGEAPRNTTDPSLDPVHLTPEGRKKFRKVDRGAQQSRFEESADARANETIPREVTATPGDNLKIRIKKVPGIDD